MPRLTFLPLSALFATFAGFVFPAARAADAPLAPAPAFAYESSDLKPDPALRFGKLPNGMRYILRKNSEPRDRASLRLVVEAGSLYETESQRGLAHFLEHMAFNGSTHYAPDTLVEVFQRMGMSFGGDSNASTGYDQTLYQFELPNTQQATFAEAFQVFSDYAGGLLLLPEEIDKERGVILSEERQRDSVDYRTMIASLNFELKGTLFPVRLPIGSDDVIRNAKRPEFADFYDSWYRPERMTVIAVGDFDVDAVEQQLRTAFSGLRARAPARPVPNYGTITDARGLQVAYHYEKEAPSTSVSITTITPYSHEPDTAENRLKYLPRTLAVSMLNRRLDILAKKEGSTFTSGDSYATEAYDFIRSMGIEMTTKPELWRQALGTAEQELRRALEYGFQEAELREVVANYRNSLEQAVQTAPTRRSAGFAAELSAGIVQRIVPTTPEEDLALFGPALDSVTVEDCAAALKDAWDVPHRYIFVSGNALIPAATAANAADDSAQREIAAAYNESAAVALEAPESMGDMAWDYTDFGEPATVTSRQHIDDLDVTLVTFSNGVRLNMKKTDFEANRIRIGVRIGTGSLSEPPSEPGLGFFIDGVYSSGGLGKYSADELDRILAGKTVGFGFSVGSDALSAGATTNPEDELLQFQLIMAYLTDPGWRPEALRQSLKETEEFYTGMEHELGGPLQMDVPRLLAGGDARFGLPTRDEVLARTVDEAKAWLAPQIATGAMEVAIVGDFDVDATIDIVARTLGTLPTREPLPDTAALRAVQIPSPFTREFAVETEIPKGVVALYWPTLDEDAISENRRLAVLASIYENRMTEKLREEQGNAYSPAAGNIPSSAFRGYGFLQANVIVDPAEAQTVGDAMLEISDDLAKNGVTQDELVRAQQPLLTSLRESDRTNTYWGRVISRAQTKPVVLDWSRTRYSDVESITKEEVDALAKRFLPRDRVFRVTVLPKPAGAPDTALPEAK